MSRKAYLGLSTSGHDPAFAIVDESGKVLFAEATERFLQDKIAWGAAPDHLPHLAAAVDALGLTGVEPVVSVSWKTNKAELVPEGSSLWMSESQANWLYRVHNRVNSDPAVNVGRAFGLDAPVTFRRYEHHRCHAAFACASSPFDSARCIVMDGDGDVGAASAYDYSEGRLTRVTRSWGPGSLGGFYAWVTRLSGFDPLKGEEWKVMGLAAYGTPNSSWVEQLCRVLTISSAKLLSCSVETQAEVVATLGPFLGGSGDDLMKAADLAASGQAAFGIMADQLLESMLPQESGNLVLSGGCALNSSYNGTVLHRLSIDGMHVPSAPADDGNAIGAALLAWSEDHPGEPIPPFDRGYSGSPFLGSEPDIAKVAAVAREAQRAGLKVFRDSGNPARLVSESLAKGSIVGVMHGRAEFGPRALGNRSILADPRSAGMKDLINRKVKGREPFRPFAPVVPEETIGNYFTRTQYAPYMSYTLPWNHAAAVNYPAVVHADGTGRVQTVTSRNAPFLSRVLTQFRALTRSEVLLNTSFNVMGKPIVHSVEDAMSVFLTTGIDAVLVGDTLVEKAI